MGSILGQILTHLQVLPFSYVVNGVRSCTQDMSSLSENRVPTSAHLQFRWIIMLPVGLSFFRCIMHIMHFHVVVRDTHFELGDSSAWNGSGDDSRQQMPPSKSRALTQPPATGGLGFGCRCVFFSSKSHETTGNWPWIDQDRPQTPRRHDKALLSHSALPLIVEAAKSFHNPLSLTAVTHVGVWGNIKPVSEHFASAQCGFRSKQWTNHLWSSNSCILLRHSWIPRRDMFIVVQ